MLSIGWVMFFKALVVSLWAAIVECWDAWKSRRGISLRLDKKRNVYVPDDTPERIERGVKRLGDTLMWAALVSGLVVFPLCYYFGFPLI